MLYLHRKNGKATVNFPGFQEDALPGAVEGLWRWRFDFLVECAIYHFAKLSLGPISAVVRWSGFLLRVKRRLSCGHPAGREVHSSAPASSGPF
jgi:hypothetical protein